MRVQIQALKVELIKNKSSNMLWLTFIAFALAPIMGGVFLIIVQNQELLSKSGALSAKAQIMNFSATWNSYFGLLTQVVGVGGVLVFGFVSSWLFGREYSDGTAKDLLSLPTSRTKILNAKFIVYIFWCIALAISNLLVGLCIGSALQLPSMDSDLISTHLSNYTGTTVLTILIGTPIAFFAILGKGYLAPLGFVALTLVFAQMIASTGYGAYFPWSVPGLYSGAGGEYKSQLNLGSYTILMLTSIIGYFATLLYWRYSDQTK